MSTSIRVLLRNKPNKVNQYPIVIRITKDRKSTYTYLGHYINKKDWDEENRRVKKSNPNSTRLNNLIATKLAEANNKVIDLQTKDELISAARIKNEIVNPLQDKSFNQLAREYIQELEDDNKLTRVASDRVRINHVISFAKSNQLSFREIDEAFLRKFSTYLKKTKGNSDRSIVNALVVVRLLFNRAIRDGIIDQKYYPFGKNRIQIKYPDSQKIGLSIEEVVALEDLDGLSDQENHARNVWLFSFYMAGIRVADLLQIKWSDIYDKRLHYQMNKNSKLLSLKIPEKASKILEHYKHLRVSNNDFIFPELKMAVQNSPQDFLTKTKTATKKFNKYLTTVAEKANIEKKLTMHIARHTFGQIAGDTIPIQILQKLYRHSSITTTMNYQKNFQHKDSDDALRKVLDY